MSDNNTNQHPTESKSPNSITGAATNLASAVGNYAYQAAQSVGQAIGLTATTAATSVQETGETLQVKAKEFYDAIAGQTQSTVDELSTKVSSYVEYTRTLGNDASQRAAESATEANDATKDYISKSFQELQDRALLVKKSIVDYTNRTVESIEGKTDKLKGDAEAVSKDPNAGVTADPIGAIKTKAAVLSKAVYDYTHSTLDSLEAKYPDQAAKTRQAINSVFDNIFPPKSAEDVKHSAQQSHVNSETYDKLNQAILNSNISADSEPSVHDRVEAIQGELKKV